MDGMAGFPTVSRHCRIVCIKLQREMNELRQQNEELKETMKELREQQQTMEQTMKEMHRENVCPARARRAAFRLFSPRRAPKHTPWKRP